jgi:hypothetical protein
MYKPHVQAVLDAVDNACLKQLVAAKVDNTAMNVLNQLKVDNTAMNVLNQFFEFSLGFEPFYALMPTRLANFVDTIHSDSKVRDFIYNAADGVVFKLKCLKTDAADGYKELVEMIAYAVMTTRSVSHLSPEAFLSTVDIPTKFRNTENGLSALHAFLHANPIIIMFYVVSQHITELKTFNEIYLKGK